MSKTFTSKYNPAYELSISGEHGDIVLRQVRDGRCKWSIALDPTDAPAIALAFLDAAYPPAGYVLDGSPEACVAVAADYLRRASSGIERKAKEAADREVLWQEASDLYHSVFPDNPAYATPAKMPEHLRDGWVRAALKAREIHGGTK